MQFRFQRSYTVVHQRYIFFLWLITSDSCMFQEPTCVLWIRVINSWDNHGHDWLLTRYHCSSHSGSVGGEYVFFTRCNNTCCSTSPIYIISMVVCIQFINSRRLQTEYTHLSLDTIITWNCRRYTYAPIWSMVYTVYHNWLECVVEPLYNYTHIDTVSVNWP